MKSIKILFVEDHNMVRFAIKTMLKNQTYFNALVDETNTGENAVVMALKEEYDIIILDINMPGMNGIKVAEKLRSRVPSSKVIALSMHQEEHIVSQMLATGAKGYVLKNSGLDELTKAIVTVNNGDTYYCNEISQIVLNDYKEHDKKKDLLFDPIQKILTGREIEVLKEIALALSDKEIADKLKISHRTVGNHRTNLLNKLKINKTAGLVAFAYKNNIV